MVVLSHKEIAAPIPHRSLKGIGARIKPQAKAKAMKSAIANNQ
jgi:hypothetical protein